MFARPKPGYTPLSAQASLQPLLSQILRREIGEPEMPDIPQELRDQFLARKVRVVPAASGYSELRQRYSTALVALMSMVGVVLVIACFNVASMLIARASARQKEIAVRLAIGASRGQLARQLLVESAVISIAGGLLGLLFSAAIIGALLSFLPDDGMLLTLSAQPDWRILAFNLALAFLTCLVFGLVPAWQTGRVDLCGALKEGGALGPGGSVRLRKGFVIAQVAFSFLLLAGAGLLIKTLVNLKGTNLGFHNVDNLLTFQVDPARSGYSLSQVKTFHRQLQEKVRALPGVDSAGYAWIPVLSGREADWRIVAEGRLDDVDTAFINCVSPGYWRTMGQRLVDGRDFDHRDAGERFRAAIVNRALAEQLFPGRTPVGRHIGLVGQKPDIEIIGIVENSLNEGVREGVRPQAFFSFDESNFPYPATFYARTSASSDAMLTALRRAVQQLDPSLPVYEMKTLDRQLDETLATERLTATLSTAFGLFAALLAGVGLYGVMALVVTRRTREIGLRMALGAARAEVCWKFMQEALVLLGAGLALGIPCAYWLTRYVASQLFGVKPTDIATAALASALLAAVAVSAVLLPVRRASSIDPIQALRHE
jgi:predicted permease